MRKLPKKPKLPSVPGPITVEFTCRERAGWRCQDCGTPHRRAQPLAVAHIDGDPLNDEPDNLRALCSSCAPPEPAQAAEAPARRVGRPPRPVPDERRTPL
jgi:hypothetical protein